MSSNALADLLGQNSTDPKVRLELGKRILAEIRANGLPGDSSTLTTFMDVAAQWLHGTNYKVSISLAALEIMNASMDVLGDEFVPYLTDSLSELVERLGDSRLQVRQETLNLIMKLMQSSKSSPQVNEFVCFFIRRSHAFSFLLFAVGAALPSLCGVNRRRSSACHLESPTVIEFSFPGFVIVSCYDDFLHFPKNRCRTEMAQQSVQRRITRRRNRFESQVILSYVFLSTSLCLPPVLSSFSINLPFVLYIHFCTE
ncbi:unnamed protein product [Soboliphyme baturini]|uniref:TOG domain-containing protein n=1 Tax=Soboliphyme baturini TaxID=241478 RepID=A0A183IAU5_9BILA|nr:unnamed protein product [Soboliphyme baturini]